MRILAIKGENLASLADRFELDFSGSPLGTTGLFAITGETGAGKSTILDALCLALYGRYPRVSVQGRESVPDADGATIQAWDGRAILRRGAGSCFAEVDFVGQDRVSYRAKWATNRARHRVDGKLQHHTHTLIRIDDQATISESRSDVPDQVALRTDLTYDQFRRTVVLAQGEFDVFLLASESERADLLEKITGTAIYSDISRQVHAGADAQRRSHAELVGRRNAIGLLAPDIREAKDAELAVVEAALPALLSEQEEHASAVGRARRLIDARDQVATAEGQLEEAVAALAEARPSTTRLAELDAAEPLRASWEGLRDLEVQLETSARSFETALADLRKVEDAATSSATDLSGATEANGTSERQVQSFAAVWEQAETLDRRIETCLHSSEEAERRQTAAAHTLKLATEKREALDRRRADLLDTHGRTVGKLGEAANWGSFADRTEEIVDKIAKRRILKQELSSTTTALEEAEEKVRTAAAAIAEAKAAADSFRAKRQENILEKAAKVAARAKLDADAAEDRRELLEDLLELLVDAREIVSRYQEAEIGLRSAEESLAAAEEERATASTRRQEAETALGMAKRASTEISALTDLAEGSRSSEAAYLRSLLVTDKECPVCGSCDHPYTHESYERDEIGRLADALRTRKAAVEAEMSEAETRRSDAASMEAVAQGRSKAAAEARVSAERAMSATADAYVRLRPDLETAWTDGGIAGTTPSHLADDAAVELDSAMTLVREMRAACDTLLRQAHELTRGIGAHDSAVSTLDVAIATSQGLVDREDGPRGEAALAAERARTNCGNLEERIASLVRELGSHLSNADLSEADLDREGVEDRFTELGREYRELRETESRLVSDLAQVGEERAVAVAAEKSADGIANEAARSVADCSKALDDARSARAPLLDGEETGQHRNRIVSARENAREALQTARDAAASARSLEAEKRGIADSTKKQRDRYLEQVVSRRRSFQDACGDRTTAVVGSLLEAPASERTGLRAEQDTLLRAREAAETTLANRRADLDKLLARPPVDLATSEAALADVNAKISEHQQRFGAVNVEIQRDDQARKQVAELADRIEESGTALAYWEQVNDAVGSSTGDKFRRFAQGVTLEHLVQLANTHLASLTPRYALVRSWDGSLAIHVLDRDLGDELRGTRSLSGGERFLVALALALALSGLEGRQGFVDTLFIDEGFGSLDVDTLDVAVGALETLQGQGRKVGVITHVAAMIDRIGVQVRVEKRGYGRSVVRVTDGLDTA